MKEIIKIKELTKLYGTGNQSVAALKNINLCVEEGKFVVIVGNSGSGKSTLFNIIAGIDKPTKGTAMVNDIDLSSMNERELTNYRKNMVGLIFQYYNLLSDLTALENIKLATQISKSDFNINDISEKLGISELLDKFPYEMSGGQQQRIAIARAIAKDSVIILCDEPTAALDSSASLKVLEILCDCNKKFGKTILLITHNYEIMKMADIIIRLRDGEIISIEEVKDIKKPSELVL